MSWWQKNWRWMLAVIISTLGLLGVAIFYVCWKHREAKKLKEDLALLRMGAKVEGLRKERTRIATRLGVNAAETKKLDTEIAQKKREAVAVVKDVRALSDEQIAAEFTNLGY